jgi:hypothetical protein
VARRCREHFSKRTGTSIDSLATMGLVGPRLVQSILEATKREVSNEDLARSLEAKLTASCPHGGRKRARGRRPAGKGDRTETSSDFIGNAFAILLRYQIHTIAFRRGGPAWPRGRREGRERMVRAARAIDDMIGAVPVFARLVDRMGASDTIRLIELSRRLVAEAEQWGTEPVAAAEQYDLAWLQLVFSLRAIEHAPGRRLSASLIAELLVGCGIKVDHDGTLAGNIQKLLQRYGDHGHPRLRRSAGGHPSKKK